MKRVLIVAALAALALPGAALAKGPSEAHVTGPGLGNGATFTGSESEPSSSVMTLADAAGFFPSVFGQEPNPMLPAKPKGDLGPKYTIVWTVPGGGGETFSLHQDAYPYAKPYGVAYMAAGQPIFGATTTGGWFQSPTLKEALKVPKTAPAVSSSSASFFSTTRVGAIALVCLLGAGGWFLMRRRHAAA